MTAFGKSAKELHQSWYGCARAHWKGLCLLVMLASLGQMPTADAQRNPMIAFFPTSIEVSGIVVNAVTGEPIAGAVVSTVGLGDDDRPPRNNNIVPPLPQLTRPPRKTPGPDVQQITGADGRFHFAAMKVAERKAFYVARPGYLAPDSSGFSIANNDVSVMPGIGQLRFMLIPEAEVKGRVTTSEGDSLQNVMVTLYRVKYTAGRQSWSYFDRQRTDTSGNYRFGKLPPGDYFVVSQWLLDHDPLPPDATNCNDGSFLPDGGFAPEAEPGVLDFRKAIPIVLTEGKHAVADLMLQHQVFHPVTIPLDPKLNPGFVEIVDRNGRSLEMPVSPNAGCIRALHPKGDRQKRTINLPDGSYMFHRSSAYALDDPFEIGGAKQPVYLGGYAAVTVAGKPVTVTLPAVREDAALPLPIRVHRENAALPSKDPAKDVCSAKGPMLGVILPAGTKMPPRLQVQLVAADSFGGQERRVTETEKDPDIYELSGVEPGRYWVQVERLDERYVSAITANGVNLMEHPLEINADQNPPSLDITVRNDCGRLHFEKPWTKPGPGAVLADAVGIINPFYELLVPQFMGATPHGQFSEERTLMEIGRASSTTLGNLPPGHYKIFQTFDEDAVTWFSSAALEKRLGPVKDVWLKPGEQVDVDVHDPRR